jgi:hypothetical protein
MDAKKDCLSIQQHLVKLGALRLMMVYHVPRPIIAGPEVQVEPGPEVQVDPIEEVVVAAKVDEKVCQPLQQRLANLRPQRQKHLAK